MSFVSGYTDKLMHLLALSWEAYRNLFKVNLLSQIKKVNI